MFTRTLRKTQEALTDVRVRFGGDPAMMQSPVAVHCGWPVLHGALAGR
jgi:hypothetical protein